jgi:hypothetical protein
VRLGGVAFSVRCKSPTPLHRKTRVPQKLKQPRIRFLWAGHFPRGAMDDQTFRTIMIIAGILVVVFFALAFSAF